MLLVVDLLQERITNRQIFREGGFFYAGQRCAPQRIW